MFNAVKRNGEQSTLPAPVKGINDIDAWHGMKDDYAVLMENWWPEPSKLVTRKGCLTRNPGFDAPVKTIVEYAHQDGSYKIFAASGGNIFNITSPGVMPGKVYPIENQRQDLSEGQSRAHLESKYGPLDTVAQIDSVFIDGKLGLWEMSQTERANLIIDSNSNFSGTASIEYNYGPSPTGINDSSVFYGSPGTSINPISEIDLDVGEEYTLSVYVKPHEDSRRIYFVSSGEDFSDGGQSPYGSLLVIEPDLSIDVQLAPINYGVDSIGGGWHRVWAVVKAYQHGSSDNKFSLIYANPADRVTGWEVWGFQLEKSPSPTRYIATSGGPKSIVDYTPDLPSIDLGLDVSDGDSLIWSGSGSIGSPDVTGLQSDEWESVQMSTPGGTFLYLLSGQDKPLMYDGEDWTAIDDASEPAITGVDTSTLKQGTVFKGRMYFVQSNSMSFWYLPPLQIGGEAKEFNLSAIFQRGGYIVGVYTWTLDAGSGSDDHLVVLSSEGEVAVYAGLDPDTAGSFSLIGVYYLGRPVGKRPCTKFGGDLLVLCEQGLYPLSIGLLSADVDRRATKTKNIQNTISAAITSFGGTFGFELCGYPARDALLLNVPTTTGNVQYVQNTITGAWTRFKGWDAQTWCNSSAGMLFGDSDSVKIAWQGESDDGEVIKCDVVTAFSDFKKPARRKLITLVSPYFRTNGNPSILYGVCGDYIIEDVEGEMHFNQPEGMVWGSMVWGEMVWGNRFRPSQTWSTVGKLCRSAAIRIKAQNNYSSLEWAATNIVYQTGSVL